MLANNICQIACLQETKLQSIDLALASFLGAYWLNKFAYKPAVGTKGGILLLWNDASIDLSNVSIGRFSLSVDATLRHSRTTFRITAVYGPARHSEKGGFSSKPS
jgi:hypothetical protein